MTFDEQWRLVLAPTLRDFLPNPALERESVSLEGQPLQLPNRFVPNPEYMAYHRERVFRG